jgi:DNA-binding IclR family transcriptional regulator
MKAFFEAIVQAECALSVSEFSVVSNVLQSTTDRIVHVLEAENLLAREPDKRSYGLGIALRGLLSASIRWTPPSHIGTAFKSSRRDLQLRRPRRQSSDVP